MKEDKEIILGFYGDDFTGSSDVMEVLSLMGIPTILFLKAPTKTEVANFNFKYFDSSQSDYIAYGIAGVARSLDPTSMAAELNPVFKQMSEIPSRYIHYKICSTLDSSPEIGNIGVAMKVAEKYFPGRFIPLVLGFPYLNRFVAFGHLFAKIGTTTYRLDRHPVMSRHPTTPMNESDVRLHLAKQMDRRMELVDLLQIGELPSLSPEQICPKANDKQEIESPLILFDTTDNSHLLPIGKWLDTHSRKRHQLLLGSSAMEYALGKIYGAEKALSRPTVPVTPTLVVAGSCAQSTADQILHAEKLGFTLIRIQVGELFSEESRVNEINRVVRLGLEALNLNLNTVIYSALGPEDDQVKFILSSSVARSQPTQIAASQAEITRQIIDLFPLKRLATAGGDTSGYILKSLDIQAFEFVNVLAPGAPLCLAHGKNPKTAGMEIAIKGGQNGTVRYFEFAQLGGMVA
ncbi:four-carbon acid sugar kinase family protein [Lunatibacter salilacus]|uniref:four-carbon acid sugar kinase family protein n=1 Tax=Lunatibacter salilacus TaxID=2483804 RepID=UPI00131AD461|nr:four-carbon acid sugar kinase family protein [Lunatibacter salilacus]